MSSKSNGAMPDVGDVIALDHVNFKISDQTLSTRFFIEGLGLTRDPYRFPGTTNMWVNLGRQQMHLPTEPPEPFQGEVGLVVPNLKTVEENLKKVAPTLKGTKCAVRREKNALVATDPWGRQLRVHGSGSVPARLPVGLAYVVFKIPPGGAEAVGAFYQNVFACPTRKGKKDGATTMTVRVGPYQEFRFVEQKGATTKPHNNHVCLYVTNYEQSAEIMAGHGADAIDIQPTQYRFMEIRGGKKGGVVFCCEHEIRSLYHRDYGRPLVNRLLDLPA